MIRLTRILILLLLAAAGVMGYRHASQPQPIPVVLEAVGRGAVESTVANTRAGTVEACTRSFPTPSVGGQIARLDVREGDRVKKGQMLLELWNEHLRAEVELAESEQEAARSKALAACLQAEVSHREADRLVKLKTRGAASDDQTDKAVTEAKAKDAECAAAKTTINVIKSKASVAKANLDRTRLSAPFDGIVAQVTGELYEYVTPSPPGIATKPIIDLIGTDCFFVTAPIDEVDSPGVARDMPARIKLDAFGERIFEGRVRRIAPYVQDYEKQARTVDIEVEFVRQEEIQEMLAGYSADVEIILAVEPEALRVPSDAVVEGRTVYIFDPVSGRLAERNIETGLTNWDHTQVRSGLHAGELVVTSVDRAGVIDGALAVREQSAR